jgi:autotransporter adhesin
MHNGALKKLALALTFWLALHTSSLKAQIFTNDLPLQAVTTGTDPVDFEFRSNGILIAKGNSGVGSLLSGDQGDGTRMLWFPALGAFRAGIISTGLTLGDGPWDSANIGEYSAAFGYNTVASGSGSLAIGLGTHAFGTGSVAMGGYTSSSGYYSTVAGLLSTASGFASTAMGDWSTASGDGSTALGASTASGHGSTALGTSTASGYGSTAIGTNSTASGYYSMALGYSTTASGVISTAFGGLTTASAYASFVIGAFNVGGGSPTTWVATDPLFEVGNGSGSGFGNPAVTGPSDAFVVYKNGSATFQGSVTVAPGGDIPMYTGD